jgi:hypothetical protein
MQNYFWTAIDMPGIIFRLLYSYGIFILILILVLYYRIRNKGMVYQMACNLIHLHKQLLIEVKLFNIASFVFYCQHMGSE